MTPHLKSNGTRDDTAHSSRLLTPGPIPRADPFTTLLEPPPTIYKICCIGAGYVGGPTSAVLATKLPHILITVVDTNASRIAAWNSSSLPIYEPSLSSHVFPARDGTPNSPHPPNLTFTTSMPSAIADADLILIAVNTPTKQTGLGAGQALDLSYVESATRLIAAHATRDAIIVEKSTVPCRTASAIRDILAANARPGLRFDVLSNPEFLAEGTAISDLLHPDRILIGSMMDARGLRAAAALVELYATWVPRERIITMNLWSSELAKIAANALLAQRISSINSLSAICEATGAEIDEVAYAVGLDKRIGPWMLKSSVGFGGSCFKKDIYNLVYLAESLNLPEVARYWRSVVDINEWQKERFVRRVVEGLYNSVSGKRVAVWGFAYKKNTGDTRESAAIAIVDALVRERAEVCVYDPRVREEQVWMELEEGKGEAEVRDVRECVRICGNAYDAARGAHAVVIVTEWDEFRVVEDVELEDEAVAVNGHGNQLHKDLVLNGNPHDHDSAKLNKKSSSTNDHTDDQHISLNSHSHNNTPSQRCPTPSKDLATIPTPNKPHVNWRLIATLMQKPMFVFDGRNIIDAAKLEQLGFRVECIGNARSGGRR